MIDDAFDFTADTRIGILFGLIIVQHAGPHGRMSAGGIPRDNHTFRIDAEFRCILLQEADGIAGINSLRRE